VVFFDMSTGRRADAYNIVSYCFFYGSEMAQWVKRPGFGLDDRGVGVQFPAGVNEFSLLHRVQTDFGPHPTPCAKRAISPEVTLQGREVDRSSSDHDEIENERGTRYFHSNSCLYGVALRCLNFTFILVVPWIFSVFF
jgi:hypothetical protein